MDLIADLIVGEPGGGKENFTAHGALHLFLGSNFDPNKTHTNIRPTQVYLRGCIVVYSCFCCFELCKIKS